MNRIFLDLFPSTAICPTINVTRKEPTSIPSQMVEPDWPELEEQGSLSQKTRALVSWVVFDHLLGRKKRETWFCWVIFKLEPTIQFPSFPKGIKNHRIRYEAITKPYGFPGRQQSKFSSTRSTIARSTSSAFSSSSLVRLNLFHSSNKSPWKLPSAISIRIKN